MGLARRIAELYAAKVNALLNRVEDPREMVDYSYAQQQELLTSVRRGMVEVAAGERRVREQADGLDTRAHRLREQAEQAVAAGQEDLARSALAHRSEVRARAGELRQQQVALREDEERLSAAARRLEAKVEAFSTQKETIKSHYTTARLTADVTGISEEMSDAGLAARRAGDATAQAHARADALGELLAPGGPADEMFPATAEPGPSGRLPAGELQDQLDRLAAESEADEELARIKERLARGS